MRKIDLQQIADDKTRLEQTINDLITAFKEKHQLDTSEVSLTNPIPTHCFIESSREEVKKYNTYRVAVRIEC